MSAVPRLFHAPSRMLSDFAMLARQAPRRGLAVLIVLMVLVAMSEGVGIMLLVPMIGFATGSASALPWPLDTLAQLPIGALLLAFVAIVGTRAGLVYLQAVQTARITSLVADRLRLRCYDAMLHARWRWLSHQRGADHAALIISNVTRVASGFQQALLLLAGGVSLLASLVTALVLSWPMTLAALVAGAGLVAALALRPGSSTRYGEALGEANRVFHARMQTGLRGIRAAKIGGDEAQMAERFRSAVDDLRTQSVRFVRHTAGIRALFQLGSAAALAGAFYIGMEIAGVDLPRMVPLALVFGRIVPLLGAMHQRQLNWAHALPALQDVRTLLADAAAHAEPDHPAGPDLRLHRALTLRAVTVRHAGRDRPALDRVSLTCPANTLTTVVGPSGAGKSTLADVLTGLNVPDGGTILIDGAALTEADLIGWRRSVAYIEQEPFLAPGTVRDNLTGGHRAVPDATLRRALADAAAHFVDALPDGLDTIVGDGGAQLSGGERQRIAIARALLANPQLMVVDEATSALDPDNAAAVNAALLGLRGRMTLVVIGHRLALEGADNEIVMEDGRVISDKPMEQPA